jgi:pyridoxamine 5'-phosphate oxidase
VQHPRNEYTQGELTEDVAGPDPIALSREWLDHAIGSGALEPTAMTLATVGRDGTPSARVVLLRGLDEQGFTFFTNYESRKGLELTHAPRAALVLFWPSLERQIRVTGSVERVTREETHSYFRGRPRGSQLGAWSSPQSRAVSSREELEVVYRATEARFDGAEVPPPPHWGGYRVRPETIELWQGRPSRLHDRLYYVRQGGDWVRTRLAP